MEGEVVLKLFSLSKGFVLFYHEQKVATLAIFLLWFPGNEIFDSSSVPHLSHNNFMVIRLRFPGKLAKPSETSN